jgi:hypothetical protein
MGTIGGFCPVSHPTKGNINFPHVSCIAGTVNHKPCQHKGVEVQGWYEIRPVRLRLVQQTCLFHLASSTRI